MNNYFQVSPEWMNATGRSGQANVFEVVENNAGDVYPTVVLRVPGESRLWTVAIPRGKFVEVQPLVILEVNHADYETNEYEALSEALTCYVENEISTDEFYGILECYVPSEGLEPWISAEAYGLKPQATFAFDAGKARVFEAPDGYFVAFFAN